jgi:uncharacterized membrane protein YbhN (UPF0104 family)
MRWKIAATLVLTAACLGWVLHGIDPGSAGTQLRTMGWGWLVPVEALYLASHALRVWRFQLVAGRTLRFTRLFSLTSVGYLAIHVVPFRMGELVRPWLLAEREGVPLEEGFAAILVERLLDMVMLLGMLLAVGFFVDLPNGVVVEGVDLLRVGQRGAGVLVAVGLGGLVAVLVLGETLLQRTDRLPGGGLVRRFVTSLRAFAASPARFAGALVLSVGVWGTTVVAVQLSMGAFAGMPSGLLDAFTTWSLTLAGMTAIPTPGFFGGYDAACSTVVMLLGADRTVAGTFAFLLHLSQFALVVLAGVIALGVEGLSLRQVVAESRAAAAGATGG